MVSPLRAMSMKSALRECLTAGLVILSRRRRISVHAVVSYLFINTSRREGTTNKANTTLLRSLPAPAIRNPQAAGLSNLRTLRPRGPVNLKNLFSQPFCAACLRQQATTFGAENPSSFLFEPSEPFEPFRKGSPGALISLIGQHLLSYGIISIRLDT